MNQGFPFLSILFALFSAIAWGAGDFSGGVASRRVGIFKTVLISFSVSLVALVIVALVTRDPLPSTADLLWGAAAGLLGMLGLFLLFHGFSTGRMGIVAPISAILATAIPVVFTALTEGLPGTLQLLGFGLALIGIWLLSRPEAFGVHPASIGVALLAGLAFGSFFTALDQISQGALFWPLVSGRLVCCALLIFLAAVRRQPVTVQRPLLGIIALAGILDVSGNLFFLLSIQTGRLDIATVIGSLYPAVTTLLAWLLAKERLVRHQVLGVVAAVLAIMLITL